MIKVLVCGDREWRSYSVIADVLSGLGSITVVHGACRGADTMAGEWADEYGMPCRPYPVKQEEWNNLGPAAGPIRNARMLRDEQPDVVYAFYDDIQRSKGTRRMLRQAQAAGVPWRLYNSRGVLVASHG